MTRRHVWIGLFGLALGLVLLLGRPGSAQIPAPRSTPAVLPIPIDLDRHWAAPCLYQLARQGLIVPNDQGFFYPDNPVSWQDFTQVLNLAFGPGAARAGASPLEAALGLSDGANVVAHYPDGYYQPQRSLTRAEGIMALAAKRGAPFLTEANATLTANLTDADQIPDYAREGVAAALPRQLVVGYPNPRQLRPNQSLSRGDTGALICQASGEPAVQSLLPQNAVVEFQLPPQTPPPSQERRGVWLTNIDSDVLFSTQSLEAAVEQLHQLNFNTLYPTVWNWGYTLYPSQVAEREIGVAQRLYGDRSTAAREATQDGRDMLQELITLAEAKDMQVVPWFEFGFMAPADYPLYRRHPDWFTQRRPEPPPDVPLVPEAVEGVLEELLPPQEERPDPAIWMEGGVIPRRWLNPFHPEVQRFLLQLLDETLTRYDIDGIQMDDHLGLPVEFGYDPFTIALYTQETGSPPPEDARDPQWMRWRADKITEFVAQMHQLVQNRKPEAIVSVSPNPYPFSYSFYLQDWPQWQRRGLVDELIIQLYRDDQSRFIWEMTKPSAVAARAGTATSIGILSGLRARPVAMPWIRAQIQAVRDRNFAGVSFFFYETLWSGPEPVEVRRRSLGEAFATPASPP